MSYGFYSTEAEKAAGSSYYKTPSGAIVVITGVYASKEDGEAGYGWKDKVPVGEVTEWIGEAISSKIPLKQIQKYTKEYPEFRTKEIR